MRNLDGKIKYDDNFLTPDELVEVYNYCTKTEYQYGETDDYGLPPTGMTHQINHNESIYHLFEQRLNLKYSFLKGMTLYRMYVNCFAPSENPYFHIDGQGITFLYYPNLEWDLQEGGETQFYHGGNILGVPPVPNRLVMFDAKIKHRASTFRDKHRFTVAIKYSYEET